MGDHPVSDDPLRRFEREHDEALEALVRLEDAVRRLVAGPAVPEALDAVRTVHGFLATAVREHNENEEHALFPLLGEDAPCRVFVEEHATLRSLEHQLRDATERSDPAEAVPPIATELIALLRGHIERENTVLFPMARARLGTLGLATVAERLGDRYDPHLVRGPES